MPNISTTVTSQPDVSISYASRKRLNEQDWMMLSKDLEDGVQEAMSARGTLNNNLRDWEALYEQYAEQKNWPWENAANIFVPLISTQIDSLVAYISGQVLVPRLFLVSGNTSSAAESAHLVERYYNAELKRQRGDTTWFEELVKWQHLAVRDGTAFMEALWKYKKTTIKAHDSQPRMKTDEQSGMPTQEVDDFGMPIYDRVEVNIEDVYNDVEWKVVELRNLLTIPAAATSLQDAMAVIKIEYLYEDQLNELVKDGVLSKEDVEYALSFVPTGATELSSSQLPVSSYTAGHQVNLGDGQGTQVTKFFRNRGPIEVARVHSRQYDLDLDGTPEENVFWIHTSSWRMLGWMRYEYFNGLRPFFDFAPFPRPNRLLGYSLAERLAGLQNELNAQRNQRLDEGTIRLSPPWLRRRGSFMDSNKKFAYGPNEVYDVDDNSPTNPPITRLEQGPLPEFGYMEEQLIKKDAQEFTGLSAPSIGQQSSGKRSAAEAKQWQAAAMMRTGLLAMRFRMAIRGLINFTHALKKQYLTTDQKFNSGTERFTLPLPILKQDYQLDVSGASDPIDAAARRTDTMTAVQMFMQFPLIAQNPLHQYALIRKGIEAMDWADADKIIGTEEELKQQLQQAQQQQQQAAAMGGQPGQPGQGTPPGGGGGQPPAGPAGPPAMGSEIG